MLHHRKPNRLRGFDYAQNRLYFITTCVHDMICAFGEVIAHRMILNECGIIANPQWAWLENQYPYVRIHSHVIMPNHVHAIVEINRDLLHSGNRDVGTDHDGHVGIGRDLSHIWTGHDPSLHPESNIKIKSLSELIGSYKTTSSKQIHQIQAPDGSCPYRTFCWHCSFHDRIIRDQQEFERIVTYIDQNPIAWARDKFYR